MQPSIRSCARITLLLFVVALFQACGGQSQHDSASENLPPMASPPAVAATVVSSFSGMRANYTISKSSTGFTVRDNVGKDGTVNLSSQTTTIKFSDISVNLLVGDKSKTIPQSKLNSLIELYVAFFNRVPDADGMAYWIEQLEKGTSIEQLSNSFYEAAVHFSSITGYSDKMNNADFVKKIYKNVLGRDTVDQEGMLYWTNALSKPPGTLGAETRGTLINTIINAAHGFKGKAEFGWVADLLDNKITVGHFVAIQQGINYNTSELSIARGMEIAAAVTPTDVSIAKSKVGTIDSNFDLTGPHGTPPPIVHSFSCNAPEVYKVRDLVCTVTGENLYRPRDSNNPPYAQVNLLVSVENNKEFVCATHLPETFDDPNRLEFRCTVYTVRQLRAVLLNPYFITPEPIKLSSGSNAETFTWAMPSPHRKIESISCKGKFPVNGQMGPIIAGKPVECEVRGTALDDYIYLDGVYVNEDPFLWLGNSSTQPIFSFSPNLKIYSGRASGGDCVVGSGIYQPISGLFNSVGYVDSKDCILHTVLHAIGLPDFGKPLFTLKIN